MVQAQFKQKGDKDPQLISVPSEDKQSGKKCGGFLKNPVVRWGLVLIMVLSTVESLMETWKALSLLRNKEVELPSRRRKVLDLIFLGIVSLVKVHTVCLLTYNFGILKKKIGKVTAALEEIRGGKSKLVCTAFCGLLAANIGLAVGTVVMKNGDVEETSQEEICKYLAIVMKICSGFHLALIFDTVLVITLKLLLLVKGCVAPMNTPEEEQEDTPPRGKKGKGDGKDEREETFKKYRNMRIVFDESNQILDTTMVFLHALNMLSFIYFLNYVTGKESQCWTFVVPLMFTVVKSLITYWLVGKIKGQNTVIGKWLRNWADEGDGRIYVEHFWHIAILLDEVRSEPLEVGRKGFFKIDTTSLIWVLAMAYFLAR